MFSQHRVIGQVTPLVNQFDQASELIANTTSFINRDALKIDSQPHSISNTSFRNVQPAKFQDHSPSIILAPITGMLSVQTGRTVSAFSAQTQRFIGTLQSEQARLNEQTQAYLAQKYASGEPLNATVLRDRSNWYAVKSLRVRAELMKLQTGGKIDLPITNEQRTELMQQIKGLPLEDLNNPEVRSIIDSILKPDDMLYLDALKDFQRTGKLNEYIQPGKVDELAAYLNEHDLSKLTRDEFKEIVKRYMQKTEVHHRTSISADPTRQSDINNLDVLNTSDHQSKHIDPETGKIDFTKQTTEEPIDQIKLIRQANRNRIIIKELTGLGIAAAIGLGTGFAIGFVVSLAQNGLNPESIRNAFACGAHQGLSAAGMAMSSSIIGRTIGQVASNAVSNIIINTMQNQALAFGETLAESTIANITNIVNLSVVGSLTILAFSVYEFAKLKNAGYTTKECIIRTTKSAAMSLSMLALSVIAQGIWGGAAGIAISVVCGFVMVGFSIYTVKHDKRLMKAIMYFTVEQSAPCF